MKITGPIPSHILEKMNKEDRPKGVAGFTTEEVLQIHDRNIEKKMHEHFEDWLNRNGYVFIHSRMDKKATIEKGAPDFTVLRNERAICIEFKRPGQKLREEQELFRIKCNQSKVPYSVCFSYEDAKEICQTLLQ
jgi:hypothetical protein